MSIIRFYVIIYCKTVNMLLFRRFSMRNEGVMPTTTINMQRNYRFNWNRLFGRSYHAHREDYSTADHVE